MPYRSKKQAAFIHIQAAKGVPWAQKFVADAKGTHVVKQTHHETAKKGFRARQKDGYQ